MSFVINFFFPIGTVTKPPYQITYDTSKLKSGTYWLTAKAKDQSGKTKNSATITFKK